jgi:hypothetical protein
MKNKTKFLCLSVLIALLSCITACSTPEPVLTAEQSYLSALDGLAVTTTLYHPEVYPPCPGQKYPQPFYDAALIGRTPPAFQGTVPVGAYGQSYNTRSVEAGSFRAGEVIDILIEGETPVLWRLEKPGTVKLDVELGGVAMGIGSLGIGQNFGFFYERAMTETQTSQSTIGRKYSTAFRIIAWREGILRLTFSNYSPEKGDEVSYQVWRGNVIPNYSDTQNTWATCLDAIYKTPEYSTLKTQIETALLGRR